MTTRQHPYEIVPSLYDDSTVEFFVRNKLTGAILIEGCETVAEAEREIADHLDAEERFNRGPFAYLAEATR